ncbi:MAG: hypothetical protein KGH99_07185 [Thaumarchaeota archaeon]|nr:hypothetical protein [Nitrososphaerota archaeon]MDE1873243.1 hypothetical protein [Nitrososphaerota archaeon]
MLVHKVIKQDYHPTQELDTMMETFRQIVSECIRIGLDNNISTLNFHQITTMILKNMTSSQNTSLLP